MFEFRSDFNVIDWINENLADPSIETIEQYESKTGQLLTRLQLDSQEVSKNADQNIKTLVNSLPQSMTKLSNIGASVDKISESLRSLTNSGYKFKSGNVPSKIDELSLLKEKRDYLRIASEKLQNGARIEDDMKRLQETSVSGDLKAACDLYISVSQSITTLPNIPRFKAMGGELAKVKQTIEDRLKHPMKTAFNAQNSKQFITNALLAKKITETDLATSVVRESFKAKIQTIHKQFNDGDLSLTDWLPSCYNSCKKLIIQYSDWCLSLSPPIFPPSIRSDFIRFTTDVLNESISQQADSLLSAKQFDDLVKIHNVISDTFSSLPPTWNLGDRERAYFESGLASTRRGFQGAFYTYLDGIVNKPLPKSNTADNLRTPPSSPMRSPSIGDSIAAPANTTGFDRRLGSFIATASKALGWAESLAEDRPRAARVAVAFLTQCVSGASKEVVKQMSRYTGKTSDDDLRHVEDALSAFKDAAQHSDRIRHFEIRAAELGAATKDCSDAFARMSSRIADEVVAAMAAPSLRTLKSVHSAPEWATAGDDDDLDAVLGVQQSRYVANIVNSVMKVVGVLAAVDNVDSALTSAWLEAMVDQVLRAYVAEIVAIPRLSAHGARQLVADISHLKDNLGALSFDIGTDLTFALAVLSAPDGERSKLLGKPDAPRTIQEALRSSLKN